MSVTDERLRAAIRDARKIEIEMANREDNETILDVLLPEVKRIHKEREDSAMREAAGLVCWMCKLGIKLDRIKRFDGNFYWHHSDGKWEQNGDCEATEIHERLALKEVAE